MAADQTKVSRKMVVPTRKTMNPTILNLMKRKSHFNAVSPKLLADLPMFIKLKTCFIVLRALDIFKQSTLFVFTSKNYKQAK